MAVIEICFIIRSTTEKLVGILQFEIKISQKFHRIQTIVAIDIHEGIS